MESKKEFWERVNKKYEDKNKALRNQQLELRHHLEAMESLIEPTDSRGFRSCTCPPPPSSGGFFQCLKSMFPPYSKSPTPLAQQQPIRAKEDDLCGCDPCMYEEPTNDTTTTQNNTGIEEDCECNPCPYADPETNQTVMAVTSIQPKEKLEGSGLGDPSRLSLNSMDIFYMQKIQNLANEQKNLMGNIGELEQKKKIFENVFQQYKSKQNFDGTSCPCPQPAKKQQTPSVDEKTVEELKIENFLLKHEMKEMRLEVRQYLEKMELPMQYKIESERYKARQLEIQLEKTEKELQQVKRDCEQAVDKLQMKLCTANAKNAKLTKTNEELTEELNATQQKLAEAIDELVRQKISEAETLRRVQEACNQSKGGNVKEECSLYEIARELSKVLKDCDPCLDCKHLPEDLTSAAKLLKSLTDLVDQKIKICESKTQPGDKTEKKETVEEIPAKEETEPLKPVEEVLAPVPPEEPPILELEPIKPEPFTPEPTTISKGKKKCMCAGKQTVLTQEPPKPEQPVQQLWPAETTKPTNEKLKIDQQIVTSKSKDGLKSSTSMKCIKYKGDFPFNVDTVIDYIDKKPDGVHVTTTITNSGTLEVITEGPEGVIETTLVYTESGHVEVLTHMMDGQGNKQTTTRGKFKTVLNESGKPTGLMPASDKCAIVGGSASMPATSIQQPGGGSSANGKKCCCKDCNMKKKLMVDNE